jgi:hypothetical protein
MEAEYINQLNDHLVDIYIKYKNRFLELLIDSISRDMSKYCELIKYIIVDHLEAKLYFNCKNTICVWISIDLRKPDFAISYSYYNPECKEWSI